MSMQYRRKLHIVLASQWHQHGDHPAVIDLRNNVITSGQGVLYPFGIRLVEPGDWIITDENGDIDVMKPADFAKWYEPH